MFKALLYHLSMGTVFVPTPPTPLQVAVEDLEKSQIDLLEHCHKAEYEAGMVKVLNTRIDRLRKDVERLSADSQTAKQERQAAYERSNPSLS